VRAPSAKENGKQCNRLVEFVDVYPTLCDLASVPKRDELEGTSFAPMLDNCALPWKKAVFSQFLREGIWVAPDGVTYMGRCVRTERYRYVEWRKQDSDEIAAREMYDLDSDPEENNNVAELAKNREIVASLASQLNAGWRAAVPKTN
jgi:arylsulfatase A-like enzyme